MNPVFRLWRTVRWFRREQVLGQLRHRLPGLGSDPAAFAARHESRAANCRWSPREFLAPGAQGNAAPSLLAGSFTFLEQTEQLGWPPAWDAPGHSRLWQYNLHYFEFLWALGYEPAREAARSWIDSHPPGRGRVGWEPYPVSLRLVNWCAFFFGRERARTEADALFREQLVRSIQLQGDWLAANLETHLLGNHLLENAATLAFCGACFDGDAAERWRATGLALLRRELAEQILPDGVHFELSPMYLARVVYVLEILHASGDPELVAQVGEPLAKTRAALAQLCHPDGEIALLNDSAIGISNAPGKLGAAPAPGLIQLPDSGYYGARTAEGHYLVCDAGPIGPDYLPGHAHADIFSFELSLSGNRVVVDAGVHDYERGELRQWSRSTGAHNTVEIDGEDQSEMWGVFRVGARARLHDVVWREAEGGFALEGRHDGYRRQRSGAWHARAFRWHDAGVLLVRDRVTARRPVAARSRLHLHPDCEVIRVSGNEARIRHAGGHCVVRFAGSGRLHQEASRHLPRFGVCIPSTCLVYEARGAALEFGFCIAQGDETVEYDLRAGASVGGRLHPF